MAKIYTNANRVIVQLRETADNSNRALKALRTATEEQRKHSAIISESDQPQHQDQDQHQDQHQQAILSLLERPWFRRLWVYDSSETISWLAFC